MDYISYVDIYVLVYLLYINMSIKITNDGPTNIKIFFEIWAYWGINNQSTLVCLNQKNEYWSSAFIVRISETLSQ